MPSTIHPENEDPQSPDSPQPTNKVDPDASNRPISGRKPYGTANRTETTTSTIDWSLARDIYLTSLSTEPISLESICQNGRTVLVFLRRFTCATCFTYLALFAHLRPAIQSNLIRIVFITCHENLAEVQTFLRTYAVWLRDLSQKGGYAPASDQPGLGNGMGILPGEIYLDVPRKSYEFFGLKEQVQALQQGRIYFKIMWRDFFGPSYKNKAKMGRPTVKSRRSIVDEIRYFAAREMADLIPRPKSMGAVKQSPGIVVVEGNQLLYKYIVKDQDVPIPDGDASFAAALQCDINKVHELDAQVMAKMDEFMDLVTNRDVNANLRPNEIVFTKRIGGGVESEVFRGTWMGLDVAVKVFQTQADPNDKPQTEAAKRAQEAHQFREAVKSFSNEAALLMSLRHRNVINMLGFGCHPPEKNFLVAEYMPRGSLYHVIGDAQKNPISMETKRNMLIDIACGMDFLHTCRPRVIHQDLKSLNVLVDKDYTCKISDFGIAKELKNERRRLGMWLESQAKTSEQAEEEEEESTHGGTLQWMPPELMVKDPPLVTTKTDVFAFGVIMWELALLNRPWKGVALGVVCKMVVSGKRLEIPSEGWSPAFQNLVEACWSQFPTDRPEFRRCLKVLKDVVVPA